MKRMKWLAVLTAVCFVLEGCAAQAQSGSSIADEPVQAQPEPQAQTVRFLAAGDNLIHGSIYLQAQKRASDEHLQGYDFTFLYQNVAPFLKGYDICYLNQETLINRAYAPSTYPCFSSPPELGFALYDIGFRVFSTSNNHSYDKGAGGIDSTLAYWSEMPQDVAVFGFYTDPESDKAIRLYTKNGITFAFLAYTEHTNGLPTPAGASASVIYTSQEDVIEWQICRARELADVVVVAPHWGVEGTHQVSVKQEELADKMSAWGADVILGSHPHVLQKIDWIENPDTGHKTLIIYSLGNFVSAQSTPDNLISGFFTFDVTKYPNGSVEITSPALHPLVTHYGKNFSNVTVYPYSQYTPELANAHGVREEYPAFSYAYIQKVLDDVIGKEYLAA